MQTRQKESPQRTVFPRINWKAQPFTRLLLPLVLGIALAGYTEGSILLYSVALAVMILASAALFFFQASFKQISWLSLPLIIAVFAVGWLRSILYDEHAASDYFAEKKLADTSFVVGYVTAPPVVAKRVKVRLALQAIENQKDTTENSLNTSSGHVFCYLDSTEESCNLQYGDVIGFRARINEIDAPRNPMEMDIRQVLHYQNFHHRAFVKKEEWQKIGENEGNIIMRYAYISQAWCVTQIKEFVKNTDDAGVACALIIGFTDDISDEIKEAYINTGAMHVLSVSGLHVGLLYALLEGAFRRVRSKSKAWKWLQMLIQLLFVWGFSLATGASAAVLRAAVMLTMVIVGKAIKRDANTMNTLASAAFLLLLFQPYLLFNIGFQLSFLAVGGLLIFYPPLYELIAIDFNIQKPRTPAEMRKNWWLAKLTYILDWAWQVTAVGLAAQIVTLPLSLYYFHQFPMYFWLSGWAVIPLATLALWVGVLLFLVVKIPYLNTLVGIVLGSIVWLMNKSLLLIEKLPFALLDGLYLAYFDMILFYFAIFGASLWFFTKNPRWIFASLIVLCVFLGKKSYNFYENQQNALFVVHNSYKKTFIGAIGNQKAIYQATTYTKEDKRSFEFSTQNLFLSKNIKDKSTKVLILNDSLETADYYAAPPFYQYKNIRWVRLTQNQAPEGVPLKKLKVDYVVLSAIAKIDLAEIAQQYDFKKIIADGSCTPWNVVRWKQQAEELKIPFWSTKDSSAFQLEIAE